MEPKSSSESDDSDAAEGSSASGSELEELGEELEAFMAREDKEFEEQEIEKLRTMSDILELWIAQSSPNAPANTSQELKNALDYYKRTFGDLELDPKDLDKLNAKQFDDEVYRWMEIAENEHNEDVRPWIDNIVGALQQLYYSKFE